MLWGILDTLTKFLSIVRVWIGSIVEKTFFKINVFKSCQFIYPSRYMFTKTSILRGVKKPLRGDEMDRHGLILWENDATGSRKVFKYLLGLGDYIQT